jgi:hypothetical protein
VRSPDRKRRKAPFSISRSARRRVLISAGKIFFRKRTLWNFGTVHVGVEMRSSVHNAVADIGIRVPACNNYGQSFRNNSCCVEAQYKRHYSSV